MGRYFGVPLLLIVAVIQATIVPEFRIGGGGPDLVLLVVLSWMLLAGMEEGIVWAVVGGLLQDLVGRLPLGVSALALVIVASLVHLAVGQVGRGNIVLPPLVVAAGTAIYHLVLIILFTLTGRPVDIVYTVVYVTLPTVAFNVMLSLPVFRLIGVVYAIARPRRVSM